jgi:predicted alpha/beta-fold hydrolase
MSSADLPLFRPLPFLSNPHVQTVIGHFAGWASDQLKAIASLVRLADGDAVAVHENTPAAWRSGGDCALLIHGLGGTHRSKYMVRVTRRLLSHGFRVYRMDLRGAGVTLPHCERLYNAACSHEVRAAFETVRDHNPQSRIFVIGFSLGGNIALKLAGEAAEHPLPGLAGVATVAAPIDLIRCSELILRYPLYDRFYVRNLIRQVETHARLSPRRQAPAWRKPMTLRLFDELYTAPRGGYRDAIDYYNQASAFSLIPRIDVPAFLLTARDDPFVAWDPYAKLPPRPQQSVLIANGGGHLGFLGPDGRGGVRWAETQIIDWIVARSGSS